jgi:hypothetical protein
MTIMEQAIYNFNRLENKRKSNQNINLNDAFDLVLCFLLYPKAMDGRQ